MKQLIKGLFGQILLLIVLFSTACSEQKNEKSLKIIDVAGSVGGGRIIDISEVAEDIRYIPLETTDNSLVGEGVRVNYEKGRIYITDRTCILKVFDNEGKFLRNFDRRGRGPQEYFYPEVIYVSPQTENLIINSPNTTRSVFKYDSTGKFIGKFATPENQRFSIDSPLWLDDNSYVSTIQSYKDKPESSAVVYDSLGKVKLFFPIPKLPPYKIFEELKQDMGLRNKDGSITMVKGKSDEKIISNPDKPFLYRYKDKIRVVYDSNDSVLSIGSDLIADTPFIFNFGKFRNYSMDRSLIAAAKGEHVSLIGRYKMMETDGFLFMQFALRDYAHEPYEKKRTSGDGTFALNDSYAIFNKENGKFSFLNQTEKGVLGFRDNLMDGPPFWPTYISDDNSLVMIIPAYSLIEYANSHKVSEKLAKIVKNLKDTDNPIVVIAK